MKSKRPLKTLVLSRKSADFEKIQMLLEKSGTDFKCTRCSSFRSFTIAIHKQEPDLILLHDLSGSLSPEKIRRYLKTSLPGIPVLLMTDEAHEDLAIGYKPGLIDDYILYGQYRRLPALIRSCLKQNSKRSWKESNRLMDQEREAKWTTLMNNASDCILVLTADGLVSEINATTLDYLQTSTESGILNKPVLPFIHAEDQKDFIKFLHAASGGNHTTSRFRLVGLKGKITWVSATGTPLKTVNRSRKPVLLVASQYSGSITPSGSSYHHNEKNKPFSDLLPVGIYQTNTGGELEYINPYWSRLSGLTEKNAIGHKWTSAVHPDDREFVSREWLQCTGNELPFHEEFRFLTHDGEINWVSSTAIPLRNHKNEVTGYLGTITDIRENKLFERALVESQARLEAAQELAKVGDWDFDLLTRQTSWSKEMFPIHGRDPLSGPPSFEEFLNLIHPDDREKYIDFQRKVIENGHYIGDDYRVIADKANIRQVYPTAYCMYDGQGHPTRLIGTLVDVTERVKSHESIRKNEQLIDTLFSQSLDGMFIVKMDEPVDWRGTSDKEQTIQTVLNRGRIVRANAVFMQMHGTTESQTIGSTAMEFYIIKNKIHETAPWFELYDQGRMRMETKTNRRNGSLLWIQGDYICIYDEQGRITGHIGFQKDITTEKLALEDVKFSERNFREIFENSPDGIYIEDYNGVILNLNNEACRIQQLPREELIGKNIIDITPDPQKEIIRSNFKKFCDGTIDRLDSFSWDKEWNPIPVEIKVNHIIYAGQPAILLHVRDMRIKKLTEQNCPAGIEDAMRSAQASLWDWNIITGEYRASGIEQWLLGYDRYEIKPTLSAWVELIHPDDLPMVLHNINQHLEKKADLAESAFRFRMKTGVYQEVICRGRISEWDKDGTPVRMSGIKFASKSISLLKEPA